MEQRKRGAYKAIGRQQDESLPVAYAAADPVLLESASPVPVVDGLMASSKDAHFRDNLLDDQPAVFDYDTETMQRNLITERVAPLIGLLGGGAVPGSFLWLLLGDNKRLAILFLLLSVILMVALHSFRRALFGAAIETPHTAVTRTGLLHVQPSFSGGGGIGGTILIPFSEIQDIAVSRHNHPDRLPLSLVQIQTRSADGTEYIRSGFPTLQTTEEGVARLDLLGLADPFQLKRLLLTMKDQACDDTVRQAKEALRDEDTESSCLRELRDELAKQIEMIESSKKRGEEDVV